jgi:hypothetical protein
VHKRGDANIIIKRLMTKIFFCITYPRVTPSPQTVNNFQHQNKKKKKKKEKMEEKSNKYIKFRKKETLM